MGGGGAAVDWDSDILTRYQSNSIIDIPGKTFSSPTLGIWSSDNPYYYSSAGGIHTVGYTNPFNVLATTNYTSKYIYFTTKDKNISNIYWELPYYVNIKRISAITKFVSNTYNVTGYLEIRAFNTHNSETDYVVLLSKSALNVSSVVFTHFSVSSSFSDFWANKLRFILYPHSTTNLYMALHVEFFGYYYRYWSEKHNFGHEPIPWN